MKHVLVLHTAIQLTVLQNEVKCMKKGEVMMRNNLRSYFILLENEKSRQVAVAVQF